VGRRLTATAKTRKNSGKFCAIVYREARRP
jgi:hypothetical protein